MAQGSRPGGLTALAVVNFVFFALSLLGALGLVVLLNFSGADVSKGDPATTRRLELMHAHTQQVYLQIGLTLVVGLLLLLSGIGYLGQRRVMGRWLGTLYALLGIGLVILELTYLPFGIEHMISIIYPLMTVLLLNTTFREDLVH